jgi:hypothetical protein
MPTALSLTISPITITLYQPRSSVRLLPAGVDKRIRPSLLPPPRPQLIEIPDPSLAGPEPQPQPSTAEQAAPAAVSPADGANAITEEPGGGVEKTVDMQQLRREALRVGFERAVLVNLSHPNIVQASARCFIASISLVLCFVAAVGCGGLCIDRVPGHRSAWVFRFIRDVTEYVGRIEPWLDGLTVTV